MPTAVLSLACPVQMSTNALRAQSLAPSVRCAMARPFRPVRLEVTGAAQAERLRLTNLKPTPGSRRPRTRKGRGHAAGQVNRVETNAPVCVFIWVVVWRMLGGCLAWCIWSSTMQGMTCGFGNNGQKCRKGAGVRTGFEGGQTPLYRRLPKLKGIAGGEEQVSLPCNNLMYQVLGIHKCWHTWERLV